MDTRTINRQRHRPVQLFPLKAGRLGRDSLVSTLFKRRGWTPGALAAINDPSHPPLRDMDLMVQTLKQVRDSGELIVVMPDYDMDGISAGVTGWAGLSELGFNVGLYVPDYRDGHDVTPAAIDKLVEAFPEVATVITCDAGINSHAGIQRGKDLGLRMLVTDHHEQGVGPVIAADVVVNPCRLDDDYPNKKICGAFVMWQTVDAFARTHARHKLRSIGLLRLFAGLGTVSDVMDLLGENRQLVRDSLTIARMLHVPIPAADTVTPYDPERALLMQILRAEGHHENYLRAFSGFAVALKAFREHGKLAQQVDADGDPVFDDQGEPVIIRHRGPLREPSDIHGEFYGFYVAPTFNSVRRIGGSMVDAFGVFTEADIDAKYAHMVNLIEGNHHRQEVVAEVYNQLVASQDQQPLAPWVWVTTAPSGMLGLLANMLMQDLGHPVAVVADVTDDDQPRSGSMRAQGWYDIMEILRDGYGHDAQGHPQACGIHLPSFAELVRLAADLEHTVTTEQAKALLAGTTLGVIEPDLVIGDDSSADADFSQHEDLVELGLAIEALAPFGPGFEAPWFDLVIDLSKSKIEAISDDTHLRITTHSGVKVYWWNKSEMVKTLRDLLSLNTKPAVVTVTMRARLRVGEYMDHLFPQFVIEEWEDERAWQNRIKEASQ